jgi:hypothetical protein
MLIPKAYADAYANLQSRMIVDGNWLVVNTPIVKYLQNSGKQAPNAQNELGKFRAKLKAKDASFVHAKTFNFQDYDYINQSITRTFIGKATPWEIQETIQLGSLTGVVNSKNVGVYCDKWIGVDCGGFVAAYWGIGVPHMVNPNPAGATGFSPRSFWNEDKTRRRTSVTAIDAGDAAIFFKDVKDNNPDIQKQRDSNKNLISGTGSEAFHIGLVNSIDTSGGTITRLEIAESSGASSMYGGNGVNVHEVKVTAAGTSGAYVYAQLSNNDRIYFVAPPAGAGPEMPYRYAGN